MLDILATVGFKDELAGAAKELSLEAKIVQDADRCVCLKCCNRTTWGTQAVHSMVLCLGLPIG